MRLNPQAQSHYASHAQNTTPQARVDRKDLRPDKVDDVGARAERRDRIKLSHEATQQYGLSQLQEHILGKIKSQMEAAGVDFDVASQLDWSPDATAQRIFGFASGLLGVFRDQNPELSEEELLDKFESVVRGGVDEGYGQAIEILQGLNVGEEVLNTAQTTIEKVHGLFDDFFANLRSQLDQAPTNAA